MMMARCYMSKFKVLDIFSGIGGFSLACRMANEVLGYEHFETVAFAEIEPFCRVVLTKHWPNVYKYEDVKNVTAESFQDRGIAFPDLIVGGFPCQPHSVAGQKKGADDARNLWPEFARIIGELRPAYILAENVPNLANTMLDTVVDDLHRLGYEVGCYSLSAQDMGATHRRERLWIMAHSGHGAGRSEWITGEGRDAQGERPSDYGEAVGSGFELGHANSNGFTRHDEIDINLPENQRQKLQGRIQGCGRAFGTTLRTNPDVADPDSSGRREYFREESGREFLPSSECGREAVGNTEGDYREILHGQERNPDTDTGRAQFRFPPARNDFRGWAAVARMDASQMPCVERLVRGGTNGLSKRVDGITGSMRNHRLKALGNSIVPQCAVPFLLTIANAGK